MTILRTPREGCWELRTNSWGQFLAPAVDPDANAVITQEQLEGFELNPDTPKIPPALWNLWISLCIELCKRGTGDLEVSCRLLRNEADTTQYRICVPVQKVTGTSVRVESFDKAVDIQTGELIEQWPPEGWRPCGSSHSHNTMGAFFSGTDDKYELGDPGLHIVVGKIDVNTGTYELAASITANMRRFLIDPGAVLDYNVSDTEGTYDPKCLDLITITSLRPSTFKATSFNYQSVTTQPLPEPLSVDSVLLQTEVEAIRSAVDALVRAATKENIDCTHLLTDIASDIDDQAYFSTPNATNPFYWSDDYVL